ncbi:hypothetical protein HDU97_003440 [Phlyctochytrium planicorne]|nr:hypothetical protein HDU97_003440 [Phlyctochytrium planicorne]
MQISLFAVLAAAVAVSASYEKQEEKKYDVTSTVSTSFSSTEAPEYLKSTTSAVVATATAGAYDHKDDDSTGYTKDSTTYEETPVYKDSDNTYETKGSDAYLPKTQEYVAASKTAGSYYVSGASAAVAPISFVAAAAGVAALFL